MKTVISPSYTMLPQEWKDFLRGVFKYLIAPALFVYCLATSAAFTVNGFAWSDFVPDPIVLGSIFGGIFAQFISFLSKYIPTSVVLVKEPKKDEEIPTVVDTSVFPEGWNSQ